MFGPKLLGFTLRVNAVNRQALAAVLMDYAREVQTGEITTYGVKADLSAEATHKIEHNGCLTLVGADSERS